MTDIEITQDEADALLKLSKIPADNSNWDYPPLGGVISIPLVSMDKREEFILDISRGQINLARGKYQNRSRQVIILVRLDFGGPPHRNPNGEEIPSPHLHVYTAGFGDKWAYQVPIDQFSHLNDSRETLYDFMSFCNIITFPNIQFGLFS